MSTIGTYRFHELKLQAVSEHANKTRHYKLWDEVIFDGNRDPRWYPRRVKETLNSINSDSGIENPDTRMPTVRQRSLRTGQRGAEGTVISSNANNALDRTLPTMSWVRFVIHQSLRTTVVY